MIELLENHTGEPVLSLARKPMVWENELETCKRDWRIVVRSLLQEHHRIRGD
jgi:hypothetical protein